MNASKVLELATNNDMPQLIQLAKQEITENAVKENHGAGVLGRFRMILKYLKNNEDRRLQYAKTWIANDLQCFTNGYTGFILKNHINELPTTIPENPIDLEKISKIDFEKMQEAELNIADIKAKLKIFKAEAGSRFYTCHYDIGKSRYDAKFLIDCYTILGGKNITFWQPKNGELTPSVFESENGKAVILPVRIPKEEAA